MICTDKLSNFKKLIKLRIVHFDYMVTLKGLYTLYNKYNEEPGIGGKM